MRIVINDEELERHVLSIFKHLPDNKVLIDQFLERAKEAEIDAICDGDDVHIMGIMEHIEPAGIHSGDSSAVLPTYSISDASIETMKEYTAKLAKALNIRGLINIQFAIKGEKVGALSFCRISEALAMSDIFIDGGGQKALKEFH